MTPLEVTGYGLTVISVLCIIGMCVEPSSSFPFGRLSALLHSAIGTIGYLLSHLLPSPLVRCCSSVSTYLFYQPNPVFQLFYLVLVLGGYSLFLFLVRPHLPPNSIHHYTHLPVVLAAVLSFAFACLYPPLHVTPTTLPLLPPLPFSPLYPASLPCPTCSIPKPPRSKHCPTCSACIARFDHHCIWINQCVGLGNHRHFLAFLVVNAAFTSYAAVVLATMLRWVLWQGPAARHFPQTALFYFHFAMARHSTAVGLLMVSLMTAALLIGFTCYHVYLILRNVTTNEASKYEDLAAGRDPTLHLTRVTLTKREEQLKVRLRGWQREMISLDPKLKEQHARWSKELATEAGEGMGTGGEEEEAWWDGEGGEEGRRARLKELFRLQDEAIAEINKGREQFAKLQEEEEGRVTRGEGKKVANVYDRGWLRNLAEVFLPDRLGAAPTPLTPPRGKHKST